MRIFGWLRKRSDEGEAVRAWHAQWQQATESLDADAVERLQSALRAEPRMADDLEIEEEMLDGLQQLIALERALSGPGLPVVETSHRVVGGDACHFSVPVSMPDDPAQPTGRLLLTSTRMVFAGGARTPGLPWHATRDVVREGRDLIFVRTGGDDGHHVRCNTYADALCGAAIARHLVGRVRGGPRPPL